MIRTLYTSSTTNNCTSYSRIVSFGIQKKESRDRLFLLSIIITSRRPLVCNRLSLSLSLEFARPARETRSSPPPFPPISRVISSSSTIALESHCSTSILQSNLPPLPSPFLEHCKHPISYLEIGFAIETERDPPPLFPEGNMRGNWESPGNPRRR